MNGPFASGLYAGVVSHVRLRPRRHALRYRIFMLLLDLDELDQLNRSLFLFKVNRPGLLSFFESDHADGSHDSLKGRIQAELTGAGLPADGAIRLLCMPRMLGFVFNPISVYFCHSADGRLAAIRYEVNNTFGQRHAYLIPVPALAQGDLAAPAIEQGCEKQLFVSPFLGMDMTYRFRVVPPAQDTRLVIHAADAEGLMIAANFAGRRRELSDASLLKTVLAHPLMTLMVVAAIHWEALKLFLKGVRLVARPPAPADPVTVVR